MSAIALGVALCIAVLMPAISFQVGRHSQLNIIEVEAEINARLISGIVSENPELWRALETRLVQLLSRRPGDRTAEARMFEDSAGSVVAEAQDRLAWPLIEAVSPVYDSGHPVGQLVVRRSLRPVLLRSALMGLLGLLLGTAVFVSLRTLPLRALRASHDQLRHQATHDGLTGLPNRVLFLDRLEQAMARAQRSRRPIALLFIDLDRFKDINDSLGHHAGDQVLETAARRIQRCLQQDWSDGRRDGDGGHTLARMGGDEFTLCIESAGSAGDLATLVRRLQADLAAPLTISGHEVVMQCSIGIAVHPQDAQDAEALLRHADMAMYQAKQLGRNDFAFFSQDLNRETQDRLALDQALRGALEREEYVLHFQPKADLSTDRVVGVEALLRWERPGSGLVPPDRFIGQLEASSQIVAVGAWVLRSACAQLSRWDAAGLPPLTMAVNVSARQFRDPDWPEVVAGALRASGIAPHRLQLEMTESLLMDDNGLSLDVLGKIAALGVTLAIDDFGTGYSSLAYLKRFQVDVLKLDRSFVRGLPQDRDSAAIAGAVLALARSMGMAVVGEGVETVAQRAFLRQMGCDQMQGYLLSRALPAAELEAWWAVQRNAEPTADAAPVQASRVIRMVTGRV